jgi:hypothetical protein
MHLPYLRAFDLNETVPVYQPSFDFNRIKMCLIIVSNEFHNIDIHLFYVRKFFIVLLALEIISIDRDVSCTFCSTRNQKRYNIDHVESE